MKKLCTRIVAMLLSAVMLVCLIPTTSWAAGTENTEKTEKVEVSDDYLNVTVSTENGGFLIATVEGNTLEKSDDNKKLLYPSTYYDTSYTSIRVTRTDGSVEDYIFGRKYGFLGLKSSDVEVSKSGNSIVATWSIKDITVTQTLGLLDETAAQHGMVSIGYGVTTEKDDIADVKIRIMLDTALGEQDYGYYQLPNVLNEYQSVTYETLRDNSDGKAYNNTFFAIDDPNAPKVNAYTVDTTVSGEKVKPYQVAFGHWNSLASSVFDFVPNESINFTNQYNTYQTADSAYALYYDLGAIASGKTGYVSTYYGVYSNSTVSDEESVSINFTSVPASMTFNEDETAYISQVEKGRDGDIKFQFLVENLKESTLDNVTLVVKTMNNVTPYKDWTFNKPYEAGDDYIETRTGVKAGEELAFDVYFNVTPLSASEYRRFEVLCYAADKNGKYTEANLLGSREFYLFCPGELGEVVVFNSISPQVIHYEGTRRLYLSGQNIGLMKDTSAYSTILHPVAGGDDVVVPAKNVVVDTTNNSMYLIIEQEMTPGGYQVIFDWAEEGKENTTATALQFQVSNKPEAVSPTYGVVTVEKGDDYDAQNDSYTYKVGIYENEADYEKSVKDPNNTVYLEFRGSFGARYDEEGNLVELKAASLTDIYGKLINSINISNCIEVEDGFVSINIENPGDEENQCINIDIEGEVYTNGSRTTIWDGVCAITSIENGGKYHLIQYAKDGSEVDDVENSSANTDTIQLIWPGAASTAQTLAGVIFEFRYCQFAMVATEDGKVTDETPKERVISFGAQMSPDFLVPRNFNYATAESSPYELLQMKMAKSNYTAYELRAAEMRYRNDQIDWEESSAGTLNLYVDNILFGRKGFIGFNAAIEVGIPSYVDGMPEIGGTLELNIMPALDYWEVAMEGEADFVALKIEAALTLIKADGGVPGVDKYYFYLEGDTPGINVDGYGVFWIQGLGGGIDNVYDTIYSVSKVPPISIMLSGKFALFSLLQARADLTISPRNLAVSLSDIGVKDITLIDNAGFEIRWYPDLYLRSTINVSILDMIEGGGYIIVEKNDRTNSYFWEGFANVTIHTPDLPVIGQVTIGGASLGINTNKMWGALKVIGIDMGVTYYWGGDVDFAIGKYNAPEPTYPLALASAEVGVDEETGDKLYMYLGTNAVMLAASTGGEVSESSSAPITSSTSVANSASIASSTSVTSSASITSSVDRMTHTIELGGYKASSDIALTVSYEADSKAEAEDIAKGNIYSDSGMKLVAVDDETKTYALNWLDNTKDATTQTDANAIFSYNEETKKASVTISITKAEAYVHDWKLSLATDADVALYEMPKMAGLDTAGFTYDESKAEMAVSWNGYMLEDMDTLSVYAVDEAGNNYPLYQTDDKLIISATEGNGSVTFAIPGSLPSGTYNIQVIGSSEEKNICSTVDASDKFTYVNPQQPSDPKIESVSLGGDYSMKAKVSTTDTIGDGYVVTVYEQKNGKWVTTSLGAQYMEAGADGAYPSEVTVGGQYDTITYVDAEGNVLSASEAEGRNDVKEKTETIGLEAGKTYRIGVMAYHQNENGNELFSKEVYSDAIVMKAPVKPKITVKAEEATSLKDNTVATETIDYVTKDVVTFKITSDMAVSGTWSLDAGVQTGTFTADRTASFIIGNDADTKLTEGEHTLTLTGTNANGDAFAVDYRFYVSTTAPRLQLSSPNAGSFFGETVSVTGLGDSGTTVYVMLDGVAVASAEIDNNGEFEATVPMDTTKYSQTISVYAENALKTRSHQYDIEVLNGMLAAEDASLAIYLNGMDYTNKTIPAGTTGTLELRVISGEESLTIPESSLLGNQAEWSLQMMEGNGTLNNRVLTTDDDANGMLLVEFEGHDLAAIVGGNRSQAGDVDTTPPEVEYKIGTNAFKKFINTITFGLFCKDYKTVEIIYTDKRSGVATKQYYVSDKEITDVTSIEWEDYKKKISLDATGIYIIYVRAVDNAGNKGIYNSEGIVIFEDSTPGNVAIEYTKTSDVDVKASIYFKGNTVKEVKDSNGEIMDADACSVTSDGITFKVSYLSELAASDTPYTFTVSYAPQGVEMGDDAEGDTPATTTISLTVKRAEGLVSNISDISKTYDGEAVGEAVYNSLSMGNATYEYKVKGADDSTYTTEAPKNAGEYVVRVTVAEDKTYKESSAAKDFVISNAKLNDVSVAQDGDLIYNSKKQVATVKTTATAVNDQRVTFSYRADENEEYSSEVPAFETAGVHTVYFKASAPNHEDYTGSFTVTIQKQTVEEPVIASKVYNGKTQTADVEETAFYTVEENEGGKEKGAYDVVLKLKDSDNYKWSTTDNAAVTMKFQITANANEWTSKPSISGWTYGQKANNPSVGAKYGTVKVTYSGTANDGTTWNSTNAPTLAGEYVAAFTVDATDDYGNLSQEVEFTIAKAPITVTAEDAEKTYGDADPDKFTWKVTKGELVGDDALNININRDTGKDAKTYAIKGSSDEKANPNYDITFVDGTFTIKKATLTVIAENKIVVQGDAAPSYTVTITGWKYSDTEDVLGGKLKFTCDYMKSSEKGNYTIKAYGYKAENYTFHYVNGTLTVNEKPIIDKEPDTDKKEPDTDKKEPDTDKKEPDTDKKEPDTDKKEPVTDKKEPATDKKEPAVDKEEPATDQKEPATDKKEPAVDKEEPATDQKESATAGLEISRTDITGEYELVGATFSIIDMNGNVIESWVSDGKTHVIEEIPVGKYILREEAAPYGYKLADDVEFEVTETEEMQKLSMKNELVNGKIIIEKIDEDTGKGIAGVEFEIRDKDGNVIEILVTDENGRAESGELPIGIFEDGKFVEDIKYYAVETKTADGYVLDETVNEVVLQYDDAAPDVVVYTLNSTSKPAESELPQAGDNVNPWIYGVVGIIGLAVLAAGVFVFVGKKKGKKEEKKEK